MSDGLYILDEIGEPVRCDDVATWGRWFETTPDARRVARTKIAPDVDVSTVFLGIDHAFGMGAPLLFETMIFGGEHNSWQDRYHTKAEAIIGHDRACKIARGELPAEEQQ